MKEVNSLQVKNPLVILRESTGSSVKEMAELADVTSQAIIRSEQGVYERPLPKLLSALWRYAPESDLHDEGVLIAEYHNFQKLTREANYGKLTPELTTFDYDAKHGRHPFISWRELTDISRIGISKYYCVHPALVTKFEMQPHLCSTPPGQLLYALRESGYSELLVDRLCEAYADYRLSRKAS